MCVYFFKKKDLTWLEFMNCNLVNIIILAS